ncbi:hypothetical protein SERLA73DRAFT_183261 [Serpula lacrymans var. lacrymans S7.3]|uniref:Uncharacterized protein n=2 Tax=Serpula lacrymans var. lacrymans TaxID=341189 RepID=F8PZJ2_SERL3|nr:uncharacterized protein SERLADRAFT_470326 [Serpula lacrymans var. lacrymans S7.9]EGN98314.1 hypothetical protein SERLA73DRAFT_183261 [Serpula lacrymans var. lacrymans S7.3]EGO23880.1 hypothetical protein SERLADRAFT_470326 [Serpula lacrymans var. lacrymans S7.9]
MISNADKAMLRAAARKAATTNKITRPSSIPPSKLSILSVTRDTLISIAKNVSKAEVHIMRSSTRNRDVIPTVNTERVVRKPRSQLPCTPVSFFSRTIRPPLATIQKNPVEVQNIRARDIKTLASPKPTRLLTPTTVPFKIRASTGFNTKGVVKGFGIARLSAAVQKPSHLLIRSRNLL